ncbi:MAG: hypothetical protein O7C59_03290 [Rickettsia endosymbiont of Ixodes persulcatus]|nr:hypothetical protein [Rickettsia endosymbiont of Ixodes persulcatus]
MLPFIPNKKTLIQTKTNNNHTQKQGGKFLKLTNIENISTNLSKNEREKKVTLSKWRRRRLRNRVLWTAIERERGGKKNSSSSVLAPGVTRTKEAIFLHFGVSPYSFRQARRSTLECFLIFVKSEFFSVKFGFLYKKGKEVGFAGETGEGMGFEERETGEGISRDLEKRKKIKEKTQRD